MGRHGPRPRRAGDGAGRGGQVRATARGSSTARRPTRATCTRCCTGAPTQQKEKYLRPLCDGTPRSLLRDDRARGRRLRPDAHPAPRPYQDGDEWVINGHKWFISNARRRAVRDPGRAAPRTTPTCRRPPTRRSSSTCPAEGWNDVREVETMHGGHRPLRDRHRGPARPRRQDARRPRPGSPARPVPARPGPPRALHALDRPGRDGARHDGRPLARSASRTARCSPRSRASSG